jgi:RecB family exonuclease
MHLALKAYFDGVRAGRPPSETEVVACFLDEFAKTSIAETEQRQRYEQDGREQLTNFLRSPSSEPAGEIRENESNFNIPIGGMTVKGRIDRIDCIAGSQVRIIDYKTGRAKSQDDADDSLQLSIYALAARQDGLDPVSLVFVNLKDGTVVETTRSAKQLDNAAAEVMEVATKIAAGEFDPDPGIHCNNCSYRSICPEKELLTFTSVAADTAKVN